MPHLIAEIGLNHLGNQERAAAMLQQVLDAGADCVSFQVREPQFYNSTEPSHRRLPLEFYREASVAAHKARCQFGIAIADVAMVEPLAAVGVDFWKTLSWDFNNHALRSGLFATGSPVFLSTGLSAMHDVVEGSRNLTNAVLIHTQLSQNPADVNLKAIPAMAKATGLPVAFGLHSSNHDVLKIALAFEPHSIFFYVRQAEIEGLFDREHALPLDGLAEFLASLRELVPTLGTGEKEEMKKPAWVVQ